MFKHLYQRPLAIVLTSLLLAFVPSLSIADDTSVEMPRSALTKATVEQAFGSPRIKHNPVGSPPITVWEYNNFNVYFEYDRVIHSVKHYIVNP